jgi:hypothetical protein
MHVCTYHICTLGHSCCPGCLIHVSFHGGIHTRLPGLHARQAQGSSRRTLLIAHCMHTMRSVCHIRSVHRMKHMAGACSACLRMHAGMHAARHQWVEGVWVVGCG